MNSPEAVEGGEGPKCSMIALVRHRVGISRLHWSTFRLAPPIARTKAEVSFRSCSPGAGFRRRSAWAHILRSEEHTSELQSLMRISSAVFCWHNKKKNTNNS